MRIGVSSRGNAWLSLGPIGWLIALPFIGIALLVWFAAAVLWMTGRVIWEITQHLRQERANGS